MITPLTCLLVALEYSNTEKIRWIKDICLYLFFSMAHTKKEIKILSDFGKSCLKKQMSVGTLLDSSDQIASQVNILIDLLLSRKIDLWCNEHIYLISFLMV